jgi:hypothetical protein
MLAQSGIFSNQKPWGPKTLALPQPALDFHWHISPISFIFTTNSNPLVAQIVFNIHFIA